jgi:hypothetical protein
MLHRRSSASFPPEYRRGRHGGEFECGRLAACTLGDVLSAMIPMREIKAA